MSALRWERPCYPKVLAVSEDGALVESRGVKGRAFALGSVLGRLCSFQFMVEAGCAEGKCAGMWLGLANDTAALAICLHSGDCQYFTSFHNRKTVHMDVPLPGFGETGGGDGAVFAVDLDQDDGTVQISVNDGPPSRVSGAEARALCTGDVRPFAFFQLDTPDMDKVRLLGPPLVLAGYADESEQQQGGGWHVTCADMGGNEVAIQSVERGTCGKDFRAALAQKLGRHPFELRLVGPAGEILDSDPDVVTSLKPV